MAYRMQASVPDVSDLHDEPKHVLERYGPDSTDAGSFAANCLLARRLAERGVRFIQLYHQGWDHHGGLRGGLKKQCKETDQPAAALVQDLADRGMLDDTLVIWGGEFGRTNYCQGLYKLAATLVVTTTPVASPHGWLVAVFDPASVGEKHVNMATILMEKVFIYMTFMQHCSTYSASIMSDLLISSKVVAIALRMFMVML